MKTSWDKSKYLALRQTGVMACPDCGKRGAAIDPSVMTDDSACFDIIESTPCVDTAPQFVNILQCRSCSCTWQEVLQLSRVQAAEGGWAPTREQMDTYLARGFGCVFCGTDSEPREYGEGVTYNAKGQMEELPGCDQCERYWIAIYEIIDVEEV